MFKRTYIAYISVCILPGECVLWNLNPKPSCQMSPTDINFCTLTFCL
uniref:Uncharacterized protein n=1 Tax=Rhizophora mucronata TaxID=61149 RepID=A0A2P2Q550_RHIMU